MYGTSVLTNNIYTSTRARHPKDNDGRISIMLAVVAPFFSVNYDNYHIYYNFKIPETEILFRKSSDWLTNMMNETNEISVINQFPNGGL